MDRAASELEAERSVASAKVERYRQRAEQEGAAAQEELEQARQGCRRDQEALHAAHAAAQQVRVVLRILGITRYTARTYTYTTLLRDAGSLTYTRHVLYYTTVTVLTGHEGAVRRGAGAAGGARGGGAGGAAAGRGAREGRVRGTAAGA